MLTWDELVAICQDQIDDVAPRVFERALKDLAEPDFARATKCIDAEVVYSTVVDTPDYEMPLGLVEIKEATWRGVPLKETSVANLGYQERYDSSGIIQKGTPWKYFLENDRIHLLPAPSSVENLRISYYSLPTYAKKRYRALTGTTTTLVYLNLAIGADLEDDLMAFFNVTRDATRNCNSYTLDGNRHKYTLGGAFEVTVTDASETIADSYKVTGEIGIAKGAAAAVGDVFKVLGTGDFKTVQDLAAAKGEAPAANDLFRVTVITGGSEALEYIGIEAITGQVAGDEIEIDVHKYVPMIPEIYVSKLLNYALAMGYYSTGDTKEGDSRMAVYEFQRDEVAGKRAARGYPEQVISDWEGIS